MDAFDDASWRLPERERATKLRGRSRERGVPMHAGMVGILVLTCACQAAALASPRGKWAKEVLAERQAAISPNAAVRFSLYPKTTSAQSLKATIKRAVTGVAELGLAVEADDVSSLLTGSQSSVFEAMEGALGRACAVEGKPHVSMVCTISSDVSDDVEIPERDDARAGEWVEAPPRVACQFNVYSLRELGSCYDDIVDLASQSPAFLTESELCTTLDGDGTEVFRVLKESYALACSRSVSGHVVLTATLTANKAAWKTAEQAAADAAEVAAASGDNGVGSLRSLMLSRRTVNAFQPQLPDGWEAAVEAAVGAAIMAPNHKKTEPWRFHLLGPERIRNICELNAQLVREAGKGDEAADKKLKRWLAMPGWLVVTRVMVDDDDSSMLKPNGVAREDYAAVSCAIQNLCLSLHADGLGTKWTSGPVNFDPRFAQAAGLPDGEQVCGTLWFGTPDKVPPPPQKRMGVAEVLRRSS